MNEKNENTDINKENNSEEIYYVLKLCETIIEKLVKDINCERAEEKYTTLNYQHIETEKEREFKKYSEIYNNLLEKAREIIVSYNKKAMRR